MNTMDLNKANLKLANAANYLSQFKLKIYHIPGKLNVVPDALSRIPTFEDDDPAIQESERGELEDIGTYLAEELEDFGTFFSHTATITKLSDTFRAKIIRGYRKDRKYRKILELFARQEKRISQQDKAGKKRDKDKPVNILNGAFEKIDGLLYHINIRNSRRLCIPYNSIREVFKIVHDDNHHAGRDRMLAELSNLQIYDKTKRVSDYVEWCKHCRTFQINRAKPPGELQPIPTPPQPYETIAMDFVTHLPEVPAAGTFWALPGHEFLDTLCTITCKLSKKTLLIAGNKNYTAEEWATVILRVLCMCDWGLPKRTISDRDPKFTSAIWRAVFDLLNVQLLFSTANHPQTDGLSERRNQSAEISIRCHTNTCPDIPWSNMLPALQHTFNNTLAASIGRSPNEVTLGFKPRTVLDIINEKKGAGADPTAIDILRKTYQEEALALIDKAAAIAKLRYDDNHSPAEYNVGDTVYLRLGKGYHRPGEKNNKWTPLREGPFRIVKKINELAYMLDFPAHWRVHPVVSILQLYRPAQGADPFKREPPVPEPIAVDGSEERDHWIIDHLVEREVTWKDNEYHIHYRVRWEGFKADEDTWEPRESLMPHAGDVVREYEEEHPVDVEKECRFRGRPRKKTVQEASEGKEAKNQEPEQRVDTRGRTRAAQRAAAEVQGDRSLSD